MTRECSNKLIQSSQKLLQLPRACRKERTEIIESISTFCFTRLNHNIGDVLDQVFISNLITTFNTICPQNLRHNYFHFTHSTSIWNAHSDLFHTFTNTSRPNKKKKKKKNYTVCGLRMMTHVKTKHNQC